MFIITRAILDGCWTPEYYHVAPVTELWYFTDFHPEYWSKDKSKAKRFDSEDAAWYAIEYPQPIGVLRVVPA